MQEPHHIAENDLAQLQKMQKEAEKLGSSIQEALNQNNASIRNLHKLIDQTAAANPPDRDAKIASYRSTIETSQAKITELTLQLQHNEEKKLGWHAELDQLKIKIEDLSRQIDALQKQKASALKPIQDELSNLRQESRSIAAEKDGLNKNISELMPEFGAQVYETRPVSELLSSDYAGIDALHAELASINNQINVTLARIASVNKQSIKRVVAALAAVIVLVLAGFFLIPKLSGTNDLAQDADPVNLDGNGAGQSEEIARGVGPIIDDLENRQALEKKLEVAPPHEGLFLVTAALAPEEIEPMVFNTSSASVTSNFVFMNFDMDENRYNRLSEFKDKLPVLLFMSAKTGLSDLQLYKGQPHLGLFIDENPSPCTVELTSNPSLQIGDKIFAVGHQEVKDCVGIKEILSSKKAFTPVSIDMQRGTVREDRSLVPPTLDFSNRIPTKSEYQNNSYFAVFPLSKLESGVYCLIRKNSAPEIGYCFIIN